MVIRPASDFELKNKAMYGTAAAVVVMSYLPHQHLSLSDLQILCNKVLDGPEIEDIFRARIIVFVFFFVRMNHSYL